MGADVRLSVLYVVRGRPFDYRDVDGDSHDPFPTGGADSPISEFEPFWMDPVRGVFFVFPGQTVLGWFPFKPLF